MRPFGPLTVPQRGLSVVGRDGDILLQKSKDHFPFPILLHPKVH